MTEADFREMLTTDREAACRLLAEWKVSEWLNDGPDEAVRCLGLWMSAGNNLGDDELLIGKAEACGLLGG